MTATMDLAGVHAPFMTGLRDWLRAHASVSADVWASGFPADFDPSATTGAAMRKTGRGLDSPPMAQHLIAFDVQGPSADAVEDAAVEIENALRNMAPSTDVGTDNVRLTFVEVVNDLYLPDPTDGTPRQVLTVLLAATAVSA